MESWGMAKFKAVVLDKADSGQTARLTTFDETDLMDGDVTVGIEWSTVNYKDGLALTGKAPVVRRFPMIPGADFAGTVESSTHPRWNAGDKVILNGWGLGETRLGAYAEKARVKGDWMVRLPASMSARDAMAIGTAGYTAMLAITALERAGLAPARGPVIVTGAADQRHHRDDVRHALARDTGRLRLLQSPSWRFSRRLAGRLRVRSLWLL